MKKAKEMDADKLSEALRVITDTLFRFAGAISLLAGAIRLLRAVL